MSEELASECCRQKNQAIMNFDEHLADFGCGLEEESSMSKNAAAFLKSYSRTSTVLNAISSADGPRKKEIITEYLEFCYGKGVDNVRIAKNRVNIELKDSSIEGITAKGVPDVMGYSLSSLVLIEFFTHCCINCIHSIEDVREVSEEIEGMFKNPVPGHNNGFQGLKVISVHSPKFPREKDLQSIKAFCKRMRMDHSEVVNDPHCILWNEFGVTCWPTLLVLGPNSDGSGPNLLFTLMGEGHRETLLTLIKSSMEYFYNVADSFVMKSVMSTNDFTDGNPSLDSNIRKDTFLRFPGKIAVLGERLVVSDSGNNRLVVVNSSGLVISTVGGGRKGNKDGDFSHALFNNPQGVTFQSESVFYVADTGNHAIRKVDLNVNQVTTLVESRHSVKFNGVNEALMSPWDLSFYNDATLIIAAAGNHRLFGYFFEDATLFGNEHKKGTFAIIAGSGREENRNNSYIMKASFAQPSGIAVSFGDESHIYIADSESSSIRSVTPKGQVVGLVGGSRDPTDLFAFGDVDGKGINVKLQHPMGVCCGQSPHEIFIADTYNHKVKRIDVTSKECQTLVSKGFNEPSGIASDITNGHLYVADTNNHSVKIIDIKSGSIRELEIVLPHSMSEKQRPEKFDKMFEIHTKGLRYPAHLKFCLSPLPEAYEGGQWTVIAPEAATNFSNKKGRINKVESSNDGNFTITMLDAPVTTNQEIFVVVDVFFCTANSCIKRTRRIKIICRKEANVDEDSEKPFLWSGISWDV